MASKWANSAGLNPFSPRAASLIEYRFWAVLQMSIIEVLRGRTPFRGGGGNGAIADSHTKILLKFSIFFLENFFYLMLLKRCLDNYLNGKFEKLDD